MPAYAQDVSFLSRRAIVLIAIIVLHVLLAYGLATGLARKAIELIAPPIQSDIIEEVQQHDLPPPPPPPEFERPPVEVPPPDINIDVPVEPPQSTAITDVTDKHLPPAPPPHVSSKTNPTTGKNFPNSADYYPAASMRLGEEGSAIVHACVAPPASCPKTRRSPRLPAARGSMRARSSLPRPATTTPEPKTASP